MWQRPPGESQASEAQACSDWGGPWFLVPGHLLGQEHPEFCVVILFIFCIRAQQIEKVTATPISWVCWS